MLDVAVVGGGPAGLATALELRRAGLDVVVFEPRPTPIDKACGEGLMPPGVAALERLGVRPVGNVLRGIAYRDANGTRSVATQFPDGRGLGVRRTELQQQLRAAVDTAGIVVRQERVDDIAVDSQWVAVADTRARYVVGADGLHSAVRKCAGLAAPNPQGDRRRYGLRAHFACAPWSDYVDVYWGAHSEAYVTPVGPDCVGVALLGPRGGSFAARLTEFPALAERLPASSIEHPRAAGPLRQKVRGVVAGRVLLVGDAAGYVDALTGEGLSIAFACGRALAQCLREGRPEHYAAEHRRLTLRYRLLTAALLTLARHPSRRAIMPVATRFPALFHAGVAQLAR